MSTRKTVRLRRREIEERHGPRTFEREFESDIQQPRADHRDREELRLATPLSHRKPNHDEDRSDSQRERRADEREAAHDRREWWRGELMNGRASSFVKVSRLAFERFVGQPAKENQRRNCSR